MTFEECAAIVLGVEQGLVKNANDPGGTTNFGISQRSYPDLNIETLTKDQALALYKRDFWDKCLVDQMPEVLRLVFFDCAVNQGQGYAIYTIQKVLGLPIDGIMGPKTIAAFSSFHDLDVLTSFAKERLERYISNKNYMEFGVGWVRRLLDITLKTIR